MSAQLTFRDVTLGYDRHPAVHHLSGEIASGSLLAVVGPNGAGKSTLFRGIAGILKPLAGAIDHDGLDIRDIAYLPQSVDIDRSFPISVFDCVAMGLWREIGAWRGLAGAGKSHVASALATVGLQDLGDRSVGALSGASSSVCCSRGSCCRTHPSSCSTSRSAPSTREPSPTSSLSS
jgi:zinc/manganese transport system ATP-binding protein